jgi:hypothetical protein
VSLAEVVGSAVLFVVGLVCGASLMLWYSGQLRP